MKKTIYDLELNETLYAEIKWGVRANITRVARGWLYQFIKRERNGKDEYMGKGFAPCDKSLQK